MPALPLGEAGKYVAAAYLVVFTLVVIYVSTGQCLRANRDHHLCYARGMPRTCSDPSNWPPYR